LNLCRNIAIGFAFCAASWIPGLAADAAPAPSPDQLADLRQMNITIDPMIEKYSGLPKKPILFSTNMQFAYGAAIRRVPEDVLLRYADALKEAGVGRIDFNPSIASLTDPLALGKYDVLIAHIRTLGVKIGVNPEYEQPDDGSLKTQAEYKDAAVKGEAFFAARYKPDYIAVVHEPTTMDARRTNGFTHHATTEEWRDFVSETAKAVKAASPATRVGAGAYNGDGREIALLYPTATPPTVFREQLYYRDFVEMPELDFVTVDIYFADSKGIPFMDEMVEMAHKANKPVYIEETWRPRYLPGHLPTGPIERGLGNSIYEPIDIKWIKAISLYAATHGLDAVTPFWSTAFFFYADSGVNDTTTPAYFEEVRQAVMKGGRTDTFRAYQALAKEFGTH
jgi:hypothetical protein